MILKLKLKVNDEIEAYKVVSELGFEFSVLSADLDGHAENFDQKNKPCHFLKDNKTNRLVGRSFSDRKKE